MNQGWTYRDRIPKAAHGQTVLDFYTHRYRHSTRSQWQTRIAKGQILLDNHAVSPQTILTTGQHLTYHRPPWQEPTVPLTFDILHEDDALCAINKPSGLPVLPGANFLQHTVLHQIQQRYPNLHLVPVHRLGRGTSGVLLIAKTKAARQHLSHQFRTHTATISPPAAERSRNPVAERSRNSVAERSRSRSVAVGVSHLQKLYRTLIGPTTPAELPDHFTCTYPIGKHPYPQLGHLHAHVPDGLPAKSTCQVIRRTPQSTLLDVSIQTGRPHQIRIHLAAAGHPLLNDPLYAAGGLPHPQATATPGDCGYHLHAYQLQFIHPTTGKPINITAPPPPILRI